MKCTNGKVNFLFWKKCLNVEMLIDEKRRDVNGIVNEREIKQIEKYFLVLLNRNQEKVIVKMLEFGFCASYYL